MANNNKVKKPENNTIFKYFIVALMLTFIVNMIYTTYTSKDKGIVTYDEFLGKLHAGTIKAVEIESDRLVVYEKSQAELDADKKGEVYKDNQQTLDIEVYKNDPAGYLKRLESEKSPMYYVGNVQDPELIKELKNATGVKIYSNLQNNNPLLKFFTEWVLPILVLYLIMTLMMSVFAKKMGGKGGFMSVGKSNAKMYKEDSTGITFADVAGQEEAKESLVEIVDYLYHPEKYKEIGAKQPKGALLVGPPGTGKTLLAKAVAGEAKVPFFSLTGSDFVEMFVGVGASRVRDLFKQANEFAPCIIFIDELDAIGKSRDTNFGGNDEREQTLNQLLSEMDGFDSSKGVVILAATNRPEILDKALLRPGRFDRRVIVEKPDLIGREAILAVHSKKVKISATVDFKKIALATAGAVGADLANMVNEAALHAVRLGRKEVEQEDLMEAVEVVIAGKEKKDRIMGEKEKRIVAFHEVGHALVSYLQKNTQPVQKITIVPRTMGALGYTLTMPEEEKFLTSKDELIEEIIVFLGGRAAEVVEFNIETTGAANDIERATRIARSMVTQFGMSDKFQMMGLERTQDKYLDGRNILTCSEATGGEIDNEVKKIMSECFDKAKELLSTHREELTKASEYLIKKETISGEVFMKILKDEELTEEEKLTELHVDTEGVNKEELRNDNINKEN